MQILEPDHSYVVSNNTLILQTVRKENRIKTLIIEKDKKFLHPRKSIHLIRASCHHYGTTLEVVTNFAKKTLNNRHKVPIVLAVTHGTPLIMIPTLAASSEDNIWIAFHAIINFKSVEAGYTMIELTNNYIIKIQTSEATIQRQVSLAYLLHLDYRNKFFHLNSPWNQKPSSLL